MVPIASDQERELPRKSHSDRSVDPQHRNRAAFFVRPTEHDHDSVHDLLLVEWWWDFEAESRYWERKNPQYLLLDSKSITTFSRARQISSVEWSLSPHHR